MNEQNTKRPWRITGATLEAMAYAILAGLLFGVVNAQIRAPGLLPRAFGFTVYAATLALMAYGLRRALGGWSWRDLGFRAPRGVLGEIRRGTTAFALLFLVSLPVQVMMLPSLSAKWAEWDDVPPDVALPLALVLALWPASVTGFFTGALYEEIYSRGYVQGLFHKEGSAVIGFLVSWIPFSFGHYFSHPEWTLVQVLNTVLPGAFFCLAYLTTRSLVASVTTHALCNSVSIIPAYVGARGSAPGAHVALALMAVCSVLALGYWQKDTREFLGAARDLVTRARLADVAVGVVIGTVLLLDFPAFRSLKDAFSLGDASFKLLLLGLAVVLVGISAVVRRKLVRA